MANNNNQLKIVLQAYDVMVLEDVVKELTRNFLQSKTNFIPAIPLRTKKELFSLPCSPNRHKFAQEQFVRITHRRVFFINRASKQDIDNLERIKLPSTVLLKLKMRVR